MEVLDLAGSSTGLCKSPIQGKPTTTEVGRYSDMAVYLTLHRK